MKKFFTSLTAALMIFSASVLSAKSFDQAIIDADKGPHANKTTSSSSGGDNDPCIDACAEVCIQSAAEIIAAVWITNNLFCRFTDFPYQMMQPNYIFNEQGSTQGRQMRFSADVFAFALEDIGTGIQANFEGLLFPVIGPYFTYIRFNGDGEQNQDKSSDSSFGNLRLGGQFSLLQTDLVTIQGFMQWSHWFGNSLLSEKSNGIVLGADIRSYPVFPFIVSWRGTYGNYDNIYIAESDLQAGAIYKRVEVFGGWKYMSLGNSSTGHSAAEWNGVYAGARLYF